MKTLLHFACLLTLASLSCGEPAPAKKKQASTPRASEAKPAPVDGQAAKPADGNSAAGQRDAAAEARAQAAIARARQNQR